MPVNLDDRIFGSPKHADPNAKFSYPIFVARFIAGHLFSIPLGFVWAVASMPLIIHRNFEALVRMQDSEKMMGEFIAWKTLWPGVAVFILLNICSLIWGLAQQHPKSHYVFFAGFGFILASGVIVGAASWIWLYTL